MMKVKVGHFKKKCHQFKLKDIEVYLEDILGLNLINFVSLDLKLHDQYCHTIDIHLRYLSNQYVLS